MRLAALLVLLPVGASAQSDSAHARICDWDGWLPPAVGRARFLAAHSLTSRSDLAYRRSLESANEHERDAAARALAASRDTGTLTALLRHVADPNSVVRDGAIRSLGRIGDMRAVGPLEEALMSGDKHVRQAAAWSLGQLQAGRSTGALLAATRDTSEHVRSEAAWALGLTANRSALPRLAELSAHDVKAVRVAADCSIERLGRP